MDKDKTKKIAKETAKALGVAGASAAIGAEVLDPWKTFDMLDGLTNNDSPLSNQMLDVLYGYNSPYEKIEANPNLGIGLNAAASGIGGLAAYGLLKGGIKGLKKLDDNRMKKKASYFNNIKVNNS